MKKVVAPNIDRPYKLGRLIDWELFEVRTDSGILLIRSTLDNAFTDLERWAFAERTGTHMAIGRSDRLVAWRSILKLPHVDMLSDSGEITIDKKKLFKVLEDDLLAWEKDWTFKRFSSFGGNVPQLDADTLKKVQTALHKVFMARKQNEIEIGILAAFCAGIEGDPEDWKGKIRACARMLPSVFSVGAGGAPRVRRLLDSKGRPTGLDAFDTTRKPKGEGSSTSGKTFERFTARVKEMGFKTKSEFERAKKDLGTAAPTEGQLKGWLNAGDAAEDEPEPDSSDDVSRETFVDDEEAQ